MFPNLPTFPTFLLLLPFVLILLLKRSRNQKEKNEIENLWPEILEGMISGLVAGISIHETIIEVSKQYSDFPVFKELNRKLHHQQKLELALIDLKQELSESICDQVVEIIIFSLRFGGNDTIKLFRNLAEAISRNLELRAELAARFGWVKNSAALASIAPWLIYLILNLQGNARAAFADPVGKAIIFCAAFLSVVSYMLMKQISKLPSPKRIFMKLNAELK